MSYPWQFIVGNRQDGDGDDSDVSMNAVVSARLVKERMGRECLSTTMS